MGLLPWINFRFSALAWQKIPSQIQHCFPYMFLDLRSIPQVCVALVQPLERWGLCCISDPSLQRGFAPSDLAWCHSKEQSAIFKLRDPPRPRDFKYFDSNITRPALEHGAHNPLLPLDPRVQGEKAGTPVPQNVNMFLFNAFHSSQGTFPHPQPQEGSIRHRVGTGTVHVPSWWGSKPQPQFLPAVPCVLTTHVHNMILPRVCSGEMNY